MPIDKGVLIVLWVRSEGDGVSGGGRGAVASEDNPLQLDIFSSGEPKRMQIAVVVQD